MVKHLSLLWAGVLFVSSAAWWSSTTIAADDAPRTQPAALTLVVMDPLAAPLSCPCVEGYAQRQYEVLAARLESRLGRPVTLVFAESLGKALKDTAGRADLIIGKDSVVRADAEKAKLTVAPLARLTDKSGATLQHGLIVVAQGDAAKSPADLRGYRIFFGPADSAEKHQAALALLAEAGVAPPAMLEISDACGDGAGKVVELGAKGRSAAVISSYAAPLLEGCGTIKKGDLRVVGKTKPVPFVTAFTSSSLSDSDRQRLQTELLSLGTDLELCSALESLIGFVALEQPQPGDAKTDAAAAKKK